jgi:hypothetical protein
MYSEKNKYKTVEEAEAGQASFRLAREE